MLDICGSAPLTRAAEGLARRAFTINDVERMVEAEIISPDERLEIIGGDIVPMAPKSMRHESIKGGLNLLWVRRSPESHVVACATGLRLASHTYLEPDFVIFSGAMALASLSGPDVLLAVEVADIALEYDLHRKPVVYAEYGVRELWVIDAPRRVVHVHIGPGPGGYAWVSVRQASDRLEPTQAPRDFAFALDDLKLV
jgi:Uma2 family endonuclease